MIDSKRDPDFYALDAEELGRKDRDDEHFAIALAVHQLLADTKPWFRLPLFVQLFVVWVLGALAIHLWPLTPIWWTTAVVGSGVVGGISLLLNSISKSRRAK